MCRRMDFDPIKANGFEFRLRLCGKLLSRVEKQPRDIVLDKRGT